MTILNPKSLEVIENRTILDECTIELNESQFTTKVPGQNVFIITLRNCTFLSVLTVRNTKKLIIEELIINFNLCYFHKVEISEVETQTNITIQDCIVSGSIKSENVINLDLIESLIVDELEIISVKKFNLFPLQDNFQSTKLIKLLKKATSNNPSHIQSKISVFDVSNFLWESTYNEKYNSFDTNDEIKIKNLVNLTLVTTPKFQSETITIKGAILNALEMYSVVSEKLLIENSTINRWSMFEMSNKSQKTFSNIKPFDKDEKSYVRIQECLMDDSNFHRISFDNYNKLIIFRSTVSSAIFTSCSFGANLMSYEKFLEFEEASEIFDTKSAYYLEQYETYLQLKSSLEKTSNTYEAQKAQAVAHDALLKIESLSKTDSTILFFNRISNNHGISIDRPVIGLFLTSIFLYAIYLLTLGKVDASAEMDWQLVGNYFQFIDITHRADFLVDKKELGPGSSFVDFLNKALTGYFIYQFISAFRKYGKR